MSTTHQGGNIQPGLDLEEHNGAINAKRVDASAATVYAVVNTSAQSQGMVTLFPGPNFIGIVTVANPGSAELTGNVTLNPSPNFIGIATVVQASSARSITGNVTLSDSKTFIGLVTAVPSTTVRSISGNVTLSDAKTFIGLVTAVPSTTVRSISGNVTLSDSKTFIGLVSVGGSIAMSDTLTNPTTPGFASYGVNWDTSQWQRARGGLGDGAGAGGIQNVLPMLYNGSTHDRFRGNASAGLNVNVTKLGGSTVFTQIVSNASATTIFVAPASNYFFINDLHIASAGDVRVEVRSGATTLIPFTSLATSGGFVHNFGETGLQSRAAADSLNINLQSAVTVSVMARVRFATFG